MNKVRKPIYKKVWFWVIVIIIIIISRASSDTETNIISKEESKVTIQSTEKPIEKSKELNRSEMKINEYLEYTVKKVLGEKTNEDKLKFVNVEDVNEKEKNIEINANANLTENMMIRGILTDTKKLFKEIQEDEECMALDSIALIFYSTFVDKYGNESENIVCSISFTLETLNKINWDNILTENIAKIADIYYLHPSLR